VTTIRVRVHRPASTGTVPSAGTLEFTPTRTRVEAGAPATLIPPAPFTVTLTDADQTLTLAPTALDWAWTVRETFPGMPTTVRTLAVPDSIPPIDYTALVNVDPATLNPVATPPAPGWYAYVDGLTAQATTARTAAEGAQTAATGSQTSAAASAATATTKAGEASTSAANAATSASGASTSATAAATARAGAETARTGAETAQTGAATSATNAATSATNAATSAGAAATSASGASTNAGTATTKAAEAVAAANGFTIGTVTTGAPGASATATITGSAPNKLLNLGLPQGATGPANALTVALTTTGPETAGAVGAQGLKGDKGDPGGWVTGTSLGTNDLNTITTDGVYRQNSGGNATLLLNYPQAGVLGVLYVTQSSTASWMMQEFHMNGTPNQARAFYVRVNAGGTWQPWRAYYSNRIDQTAGRAIYQWDDLNGREQIVYGNTGARDISTLMNANWTLVNTPNGIATVQRINNTVTLILNRLTRTSSGITVLTLPAGFRPVSDARGACGTVAATPIMHSFVLWASGGLDFEASVPAGGGVNLTHTYMTNDPWPTTLPGSAIGSIPNV
jgi:hypothetical protein